MPRPRIYPDNAARQKAYRQRLSAKLQDLREENSKLKQEIQRLEDETLKGHNRND